MSAGNIYRHNYDNVLETYVWQTVHDRLLDLETVVLKEIEPVLAPKHFSIEDIAW